MKTSILKFIFLALCLLSNEAFACLNDGLPDVQLEISRYKSINSDKKVPYGNVFNDEESLKESLALQSKYARALDSLFILNSKYLDKRLGALTRKGIVLIFLKRYEEAIELYTKIEQISPNLYPTAANMGTAYELMGKDALALYYIKKAVKINPESHNSSEWIHVRILEAKMRDERFYTSDYLIMTNFGKEATPQSSYTPEQLQKLHDALYYQLNERVSFIKGKDKIVAELLFDLGNTAFLLKDYASALEDYQLAAEYGFSKPLLQERIAKASSLKRGKANTNYRDLIVVALLLGLGGIAVYRLVRK